MAKMFWGIATRGALALAAAWALIAGSETALAAPGQPVPWQTGLQEGVTAIKHQIASFHDLLLAIITAICLFVLGLLVYVMVRFNAKANPTPRKFAHHTPIEIVWTVVPVFILIVIAIPSFRLLYFSDVVPEADMTVKAVGHQWYWSYEYPDHGNFTFDSFMKEESDLQPGEPRLLAVDNRMVVPVNKTIRLQTTSTDVLHSFAMPAFGVKIDSVPGRLNETWFKAEREGIYYGQCSELCGVNHGFMPIAIEVVSEQKFNEWVGKAQKEYAAIEPDANPTSQIMLAAKATN
jgi:cytochrome c oxidase subunit 2